MRNLIPRAVAAAAAAAALAIPAAAAAAQAPVLSWAPVTAAGTYDYGTLTAGQAVAKTFTLANTGSSASSALKITLTGSSAFTKTADTCSSTSLGPKKTCTVTITYTPAGPGQDNQATLTAVGNKPAATATLTLAGAAAKATPVLTASPGAGGRPGTAVTDTATLTGGSAPTGSVEFRLYGPSTAADCSGTPVFDQQVSVSGDGAYPSPSFTPTQAGTYWWTASYTGDAGNTPAATGCGDQSVTITGALYWADNANGTIWEAGLDGTSPQAIVTGQGGLNGVTADGSHLYWAISGDGTNGTIWEAGLDGSSPQAIVTGGQNDPDPTWVAIAP